MDLLLHHSQQLATLRTWRAGKLLVLKLDDVIRIRTGERGSDAI